MSERQMATTMEEVRADHRLRYELAIEELKRRGKTGTVIDAGCGVGYGSWMLSQAVDNVISIEINEEAHDIYRKHWQRPNITFHNADLLSFEPKERVDAVVCFEFIEHVEFYDAAIKKFSEWSEFLIISTPNEEVRPHLQEPVNPFHFRHFRPTELSDALGKHRLHVESWQCQRSGAKPEIHAGTAGKFIIAICQRAAA
ncbi:class I SAM-dependent methyltransferase [Blastopirellula retiformator]|uniref:Putative S-adenosylmethionine-dependent methyltransferase n=1 Tax=Blastopirellula retiformator TaxID=2527970 RepID=A0A5C5UWY3_9BACT|nr:class I SAM-dependent methyltransferase [Blastopirellula retiformator]TWT30851.1 putative S-adenosylmethionine-dependent methyltransferase [Blastopirellula retiformator]